MKRRKRLLAGLLCAIISVTTVMPTGIQALAKQPEQGGASLIAEETAGKAAKPEVQNREAGTDDAALKDPETQVETETENSEPAISGTEPAAEKTEAVTETAAETESGKAVETGAETETETETTAETDTETEAETETETEAETEAEPEAGIENSGEKAENTAAQEIISDAAMQVPLEQAEAGEYPNAEIPFEIDGNDIYAGLGKFSVYRASKVDITASKYDPRTEAPEEMTSVKNQNPWGTCWAFATMALLENSMIRQGLADRSLDLSERHLAYFSRNSGSDRLGNASDDSIISVPSDTYLRVGGNTYMSAIRLMNWQGAALEADYPYSYAAPAPIDASCAQDAAVLAHDFYFVPTSKISKEEKIDAVKKLIAEFGCVQWSYFDADAYRNSDKTAYYNPVNTSTNHAITVVGWDDNYSADNFGGNYKPDGNGAW
ncbi:MAG: C1 family peptidase, partial [Lachnospiraceae bacterium]|nr:C1 family peptidase [Lachnospiraceae bacterium]